MKFDWSFFGVRIGLFFLVISAIIGGIFLNPLVKGNVTGLFALVIAYFTKEDFDGSLGCVIIMCSVVFFGFLGGVVGGIIVGVIGGIIDIFTKN
ncbi:MAG: hypothetical protein LBJ67_13450 [Planctomycetaceae bacterium]|jgi:hypothetical protein|nr:hypothetical protein [Planctomycetaceae bacterium]